MKANLNARLVIVSMLVLVSMLAAALPQTPAAAATCRTYYTVKKGDTSVYIAKTFGVKWKEIARANNLKDPSDLEAGMWLCIPPAGLYLDDSDRPASERRSRRSDKDEEPTNPKARVVFTVAGDRIFVDASNFDQKSFVKVRVRNPDRIAGGWFVVGTLRIPAKRSVRGVFDLPKELEHLLYVNVCLKDQTTDETYCDIVVNY